MTSTFDRSPPHRLGSRQGLRVVFRTVMAPFEGTKGGAVSVTLLCNFPWRLQLHLCLLIS